MAKKKGNTVTPEQRQTQRISALYPLKDIYSYGEYGIAVTELKQGNKTIKRKCIYLSVEPVAFSLYSEAEKKNMVSEFSTALQAISNEQELQVYSYIQPISMEQYIQELHQEALSAFSYLVNKQALQFREQYLSSYENWLRNYTAQERYYIICISEAFSATADLNLRNTAENIQQILSKSMPTHILSQEELHQLFYTVAHPLSASILSVEPLKKYRM